MSKNTEKDNVVQMDFGTTEPRITETTEKEMLAQEQVDNMCLNVGRSTLEWAMFAQKDEFVQHMMELYNAFHMEEGEANGN
jgi:hypothetical protein